MSNRKIGNFDFCVQKPSIAAAILSTKLNFEMLLLQELFSVILCKVDNGYGLEIVLDAVVKKCPFIKVP